MLPSHTWTRALAAALALLASACGQTTPSYPPPLAATTGGAGGSTTTNAPGMGGSGGTSIGSTSGAGCVGGLAGTLGGIDVSGTLTRGFSINSAELDLWPLGFGGDGFLLVVDDRSETTPHPLPLMRLPTAGPDPGAWYLFSSVSITMTAAGTSFTLGAAQRLGVCPGSAITGTVSFCFGPAGTAGCSGMESATSVTLGGASTTWPDGGGFADTNLFTVPRWEG